MYRYFAMLTLVSGVFPAPQSGDSEITYVKMQPVTVDAAPYAPRPFRESRIENLPLTIKGHNIDMDVKEQGTTKREIRIENNKPQIIFKQIIYEEDTEPSAEILDTSDTDEDDRQKNTETTATLEPEEVQETTTEVVAKKDSLDEIIRQTEEHEARTHPPPKRFHSKLSYFQKPNKYGVSTTNQVDRSGIRKFRSRCRCEKIWNCPKIQITIPRCPEEYFLCCF